MKIKVDLTGEKFNDADTVSFYDSKTIFFDPTTELPEIVTFKIWGAGLMPDFKWNNYIDLNKEQNISKILKDAPNNEVTIKGFGQITLEQVVAGKLIISPYDNGQFLKKSNGNQVKYKREWNLDNINDECFEYWIASSIYFPYGACDLKLYTKGKVSFEFETNDCVNHIDYITNPNRKETFWGYLNNKKLTTNSYKYEELDNKNKSIKKNKWWVLWK